MRLQLAEHSRPLSRPIAQDAGHRQLRVVVEDRLRYAAEETERGVVPVTKRFGGLLRIGLHEAGIAVRQVMATWSAPTLLLSATACRRNVGQLSSPPYAATAWRRSVSIIDKAVL